MLWIIATITVKNFSAFRAFEEKVAPLLKAVDADLTLALELKRHADDSGEEIHILKFPSQASFDEYKKLTSTAEITALRSQAITAIAIQVSTKPKYYGE